MADISAELSRALTLTSDGAAASDSVDEQVKLEIAEVVLPMYNGLVVDVPKSVGNAASSKCVCSVRCAFDGAHTLTPLAFSPHAQRAANAVIPRLRVCVW